MATQRTAVISYLNKFGLRTSGQLLLALSARSLVSSYFAHHRDGWLSCYWFPCQKKEQKSSRQKQKSNPSLSQHSHFTAAFPLLWLCPIPLVLQIPLALLCLDSLSLIQLPSFFFLSLVIVCLCWSSVGLPTLLQMYVWSLETLKIWQDPSQKPTNAHMPYSYNSLINKAQEGY